MKGLELSRLFFKENKDVFGKYLDECAAGLFGPGSECLGFDDDISRDHDFSADFLVLISEKDDARLGVELARMYNSLPEEFMGVKRAKKSALGFQKGVVTVEGFMRSVCSKPYGPEDIFDWLYIPSYALQNASNGEIFHDGTGELTKIREHILNGMPEDVRKKKIAARAAVMAQAGQYNFSRCLQHGEKGAAALALSEFAKNAAEMIYLLNKKHMPFYKWCFKGMRELEKLGFVAQKLEKMLYNGNKDDIEDICALVIGELRAQNLSSSASDYLEAHAFNIMRIIENQDLRNMHVMEG
ncbi:MAG: DUF4037 domain-containing protein [Christensenellaceae bacterium]|nr:DUF4037 domain-containing protein [Christensenellaceae bacterium]